MALPVRHRIDHVMTYVSPSDDAWNYTRIYREKSLIRGEDQPAEGEVIPWQTEGEHPMSQYHTGASRYDMATVREYLLPDVLPVEFKLRRLPLRKWGEVVDYISGGRNFDAHCTAIAYGLDSVAGLDFKPGRRRHTDPMSEAKLEELRDLLGDSEFMMLGSACINGSVSLSEAEGNP